ncbi:AraC family transcriptional regulator [Flavobacterium sp.]|uniref:AraC family transcriptional regulator n=1 Tax=Flavobacterium sp. TaxID=239 RepID=UPI003D6A83D7
MTTDIIKYDFKPGLLQECEIVDLAKLYAESSDIITITHRAKFYHIIWFQNGNHLHLVDFNPITITPNTLLFINKDTVQRFDSNSNFQGKAILFTDQFFCKTESDIKYLKESILFNNLFTVTQIEIQNQLKIFTDLFQQIADELHNEKDNLQSDILQNLLQNLMLHSERERKKQNFYEIKKSTDLDYVLLFKDILETNYTNQKQVNFYAKQIIITEKRLNQATSKVLGKTPKQIIDDRIILESKRILAHTNISIKEVGYNLGFDEPTNFIKYFKKHSNLTPIEFREKITSA